MDSSTSLSCNKKNLYTWNSSILNSLELFLLTYSKPSKKVSLRLTSFWSTSTKIKRTNVYDSLSILTHLCSFSFHIFRQTHFKTTFRILLTTSLSHQKSAQQNSIILKRANALKIVSIRVKHFHFTVSILKSLMKERKKLSQRKRKRKSLKIKKNSILNSMGLTRLKSKFLWYMQGRKVKNYSSSIKTFFI